MLQVCGSLLLIDVWAIAQTECDVCVVRWTERGRCSVSLLFVRTGEEERRDWSLCCLPVPASVVVASSARASPEVVSTKNEGQRGLPSAWAGTEVDGASKNSKTGTPRRRGARFRSGAPLAQGKELYRTRGDVTASRPLPLRLAEPPRAGVSFCRWAGQLS